MTSCPYCGQPLLDASTRTCNNCQKDIPSDFQGNYPEAIRVPPKSKSNRTGLARFGIFLLVVAFLVIFLLSWAAGAVILFIGFGFVAAGNAERFFNKEREDQDAAKVRT